MRFFLKKCEETVRNEKKWERIGEDERPYLPTERTSPKVWAILGPAFSTRI